MSTICLICRLALDHYCYVCILENPAYYDKFCNYKILDCHCSFHDHCLYYYKRCEPGDDCPACGKTEKIIG